MAVADEVRHDTASLYRFVASVCAICDQREAGRCYLPASDIFLKYISHLGKRTKEFLEIFADSIPTGPTYNLHRQKLWTLRSSWYELHQYVKPTTDAHTLSLPAPLIEGLIARFRNLPGFPDTRFAIFHIEKLNYLQVVASGIRELAQQIASIIPNPPPLPPNLGLIGIPYSQSSSVFLNCLIPHEMGHFAYGEKAVGSALAPNISSSLNRAFSSQLGTLQPWQMAWLTDLLHSWAEEIFCDLFAIHLIGPCYSYASIEIADLTNVLGNTSGLGRLAASCEFSLTHPAFLFRIKQHALLLKTLGWWSEIDFAKSHYYRVLELSDAQADSVFTFPRGQSLGGGALDAFFEVVPMIKEKVANTVLGLDSGLTEYKSLSRLVKEYLKNGVVPSTILHPTDSTTRFPNLVAIMNSGYTFYLESLDSLILGIKNQDPSSIKDRQSWTEKLEMWIMKAIEDHALLTGQKAGQQ